ncbi:hypothetical protein R1sor_024073 [Riccia sorocarpa]|uniref:Uncharacterized protein n=1 Tax=Riccia sorocarpa TaxID=122646 RepID=A0ABD3GRM7_9MARC
MGSYCSLLATLFAPEHALNSRILPDSQVRDASSNEPVQEDPVQVQEDPVQAQSDEDLEIPVPAEPDESGVRSEEQRSRKGKRTLQHVSTKQERQCIVKWMETYSTEVGSPDSICAMTVRNFPSIFGQANMNANLQKASRWWKARDEILAGTESEVSFNCASHRQIGVRKKVMLKADAGRGGKREEWSTWLYPHVLNEFRCLRAAGLKFSPDVLRLVAQNTGKLSCSPAKQEFIERYTAYHLGVLSRGFQSGELDENLQENIDKTHFVVNMDNGRTLGFRGDDHIKYADVVSGGVSMTMVVKVTRGRAGKICSPFMIFQNDNCSYPIRRVPDNIPGVSYRTTSKSFMTTDCFVSRILQGAKSKLG